jgi:methyltransferase (TIGR00027 family)
MVGQSDIRDVSDTALWMATVRAAEGERPDAIFHDPLAALLAGERGRRISRSFSRSAMVAWGVVARTSAIDRLVNDAIQAGVEVVLNLGAGLDTRPYRMNLPARIRWIEVDFPDIVEMKNSRLKRFTPVCILERVGMDLLDRRARGELFARCAATSGKALVITEGVISYFSNDDVANLANDIRAVPPIAFWIQDFDNAGERRMPRGWAKKLKAAPFRFQAGDWFEFFERMSWETHEVITLAEESRRINRPYPVDFPFGLIMRALPERVRQKILSLSGAVMMRKTEVARR